MLVKVHIVIQETLHQDNFRYASELRPTQNDLELKDIFKGSNWRWNATSQMARSDAVSTGWFPKEPLKNVSVPPAWEHVHDHSLHNK